MISFVISQVDIVDPFLVVTVVTI